MRQQALAVIAVCGWLSGCGGSSTSPSTTPVVTVTGSVVQISAPNDVRIDALQSNTQTRLFNEVLGMAIGTPLTVDFTAPGTFSNPPSLPLPIIASGTVVNSYYLVANAINPPVTFTGSITFDRNVIGIIAQNNEFAGSNGVLGHPGTLYAASGIEYELGTPQGDSFSLSADRRTVTFTAQVFNAADDLRIITEK